MENAVVYARYSSHNQTEQSIEGQLYAAKKYAEAKEYTIVHEYCDRAKTGTNDNREEFQQMLSDCSKGLFTVIIVWKVDRFGRNREEITFNKYRAKKHGVRVEYVAESISEGPEGVILESVLEGMAEYYSKQLSQNVRRGLLESAKKFQVVGGRTPYGYYASQDKHYIIDPQAAAVVKLIFQKYLDGMSVSEIAKYLNRYGYKTANFRKFDKNSIPRILKNIRYTGTYVYKDLIYEEDVIPAIVSKEDFAKVQELLEYNHRKPSKRWEYTDYLLTDKLFCGDCGERMFGRSGYGEHGQKYNYYECANHVNKKTCSRKAIRQEVLEKEVISTVVGLLKNQNIMDLIVDKTWEYYLKEDETKREVDRLEKAKNEVDAKIENIIRSVEQGMPYELVKARLEQLRADREVFSSQLSDKLITSKYQLTKEHIRYFLQQFASMDYEDRSCQKRMIKTFVNSITVYNDRLVIVLNYCEDEKKKAVTIDKFECDDLTRAFTSVCELFWWRENIICVKKLTQ